jgi:hypothetical protein
MILKTFRQRPARCVVNSLSGQSARSPCDQSRTRPAQRTTPRRKRWGKSSYAAPFILLPVTLPIRGDPPGQLKKLDNRNRRPKKHD